MQGGGGGREEGEGPGIQSGRCYNRHTSHVSWIQADPSKTENNAENTTYKESINTRRHKRYRTNDKNNNITLTLCQDLFKNPSYTAVGAYFYTLKPMVCVVFICRRL